MANFKKWIYKYDEGGFINREHEKLEKYMMMGSVALVIILFIALIIWTIKETGSASHL
jgi:hypothetical protein